MIVAQNIKIQVTYWKMFVRADGGIAPHLCRLDSAAIPPILQ